MKRAAVLAVLPIALATMLFAGGCASTPAGDSRPPPPAARVDESRPVHVSVECPVTHPWIWSDEIAESFHRRLVEGFRESGYKGNIVYVQPGFAPPAGMQSLSVTILRWRVNRDRSVEALISADYDSGDGSKRPVGTVSGLSMHYFAADGRLALERAFDEAARSAAAELLKRLSPAG